MSLLNVIDAYSGYNQFKTAEGNTNHTTFYVDMIFIITLHYHALWLDKFWHHLPEDINKLFGGMIGITMEAYVDCMLFKLIKGVDHTKDLRKAFKYMCLHQVRMYPSKYAFGVQFRKF